MDFVLLVELVHFLSRHRLAEHCCEQLRTLSQAEVAQLLEIQQEFAFELVELRCNIADDAPYLYEPELQKSLAQEAARGRSQPCQRLYQLEGAEGLNIVCRVANAQVEDVLHLRVCEGSSEGFEFSCHLCNYNYKLK